MIHGRRGIPVRCSGGHHDPRERPISCLILHGLGGGPYEFGPLIAALESAASGRRGARAARPRGPGPDHAVLEVV